MRAFLIDHPWWADVAAAALAVSVFSVWAITRSDEELRNALDDGTRSDLYVSLTATSGALLGFVLTALAILLALPSGQRLGFLRRSPAWPKFPRVFLRAAWSLGLATAAFTGGTLLDTDEDACLAVEGVAVAAATIVAVRVSATIILLGRLVNFAFEDAGEPAQDEDL